MAWGFIALLVIGWLLTGLAALREIERQRLLFQRSYQQAARERQQLLDRIMYLAGKPWELPPEEPIQEDEIEWTPDALDEPIEIPDLAPDYPAPVNRV